MRYRKLAFLLAFVPAMAMAQSTSVQPADSTANVPPNAVTRSVLLANCPKGMPEADWLRMMEKPVNATLYPIRLTQGMLDTLDATKLDTRYQYIMESATDEKRK